MPAPLPKSQVAACVLVGLWTLDFGLLAGTLDSANTSWKSLFESATPSSPRERRVEMVVFKKAGHPLLILPRAKPEMEAALDLYPAQTLRARFAKWIWRQLIRRRLPLWVEQDAVLLDRQSAFLQFLNRASTGSSDTPPPGLPGFAILAGNPWAPGRRFQILVFLPEGKPMAVVKAGTQPAANELIAKEVSFLSSIPAELPGVPRLRHLFHEGAINAFATDFFPGHSPRAAQRSAVEPLLSSWLKAGRNLEVRELAAWQRLSQAPTEDALLKQLAHLAGLRVQAAVFHGDFAPWNIKVATAGVWTALDWERGELNGPPAWDWFHFVLQPAMLVQRQPPARLASLAESFLVSPLFQVYAREAGLIGHERDWLLAYLLYCRDVLRPAEGSPRVVELLRVLAQKWASH